MTTADTPITVSRSRFITTCDDNEYEITLATVTYSHHEHRWHIYCYTGPEEPEHLVVEQRSDAEKIALTHAFKMHDAIDQPENFERLITTTPETPWPNEAPDNKKGETSTTMTTTPRSDPPPTIATLTHTELAATIEPDSDRLADLLIDASHTYDKLLQKLDTQAALIADTMQRLRASIARSRETDPPTLSINGLGELQGQGPELDRLCGEVTTQRDLLRRLSEVLKLNAKPTSDRPIEWKG